MRLVERDPSRQLEVQRHLGPVADAHDGDVVDLAHPRDAERSRERPLAQGGRRAVLRLDVDDHVAARQRILDRRLDRIGDRVCLCDRGARREPDHHVGKVAPACLPQAQTSQLNGRVERRDGLPGRRLRLRRSAVHEHVDVPPHEPSGSHEHEHRHEQGRNGVGALVAGPHGEQADENRQRSP